MLPLTVPECKREFNEKNPPSGGLETWRPLDQAVLFERGVNSAPVETHDVPLTDLDDGNTHLAGLFHQVHGGGTILADVNFLVGNAPRAEIFLSLIAPGSGRRGINFYGHNDHSFVISCNSVHFILLYRRLTFYTGSVSI